MPLPYYSYVIHNNYYYSIMTSIIYALTLSFIYMSAFLKDVAPSLFLPMPLTSMQNYLSQLASFQQHSPCNSSCNDIYSFILFCHSLCKYSKNHVVLQF